MATDAELELLRQEMNEAHASFVRAEKAYLTSAGRYNLAKHGVDLGDILKTADAKRVVVVGSDYFPLARVLTRSGELAGEVLTVDDIEEARVVGKWYDRDNIVPVWHTK